MSEEKNIPFAGDTANHQAVEVETLTETEKTTTVAEEQQAPEKEITPEEKLEQLVCFFLRS